MDMKLLLCVVFGVVCIASIVAEENLQKWSVHSHLDEDVSISCNDTFGSISVSPGDKLTWTKHEHEEELDKAKYEFEEVGGIENFHLKVKNVQKEDKGVYFCHVHTSSGDPVGMVVRGLNLGGPKYSDDMDEWRTPIIVGVICAASMFALIFVFCFVDTFRYRTAEQKQKQRDRKAERVRRLEAYHSSGGKINQGMDMAENSQNGGYPDYGEVNTHL